MCRELGTLRARFLVSLAAGLLIMAWMFLPLPWPMGQRYWAMLLLATLRALRGPLKPDLLPRPKWADHSAPRRFSTAQAINQLRAEVWGRALGVQNFSDFAAAVTPISKPEKLLPQLPSAVLYAIN